jgi:hypothetical protein
MRHMYTLAAAASILVTANIHTPSATVSLQEVVRVIEWALCIVSLIGATVVIGLILCCLNMDYRIIKRETNYNGSAATEASR